MTKINAAPSNLPSLKKLAGAVFGLAAILIITALILGSLIADPNNFWRKVAELLFQCALFIVIGGLLAAYIKWVFDQDSERRTKEREDADRASEALRKDAEDRRGFLRRMATVHGKVEYASRLIRAHDSLDTYFEQMRELMMVTPQLWEVHEDLRAADRLFNECNEIRANIKKIIDFLDEGANEYERIYRSKVDGQGQASRQSLQASIDQSATDLTWIKDFIKPPVWDEEASDWRRLPRTYEDALNGSKGRMRSQVYPPEPKH